MNPSPAIYSPEGYHEIKEKVFKLAHTHLPHGSLSTEITNRIILSALAEQMEDPAPDAWLHSKVEQEIQSLLQELWQYSYGYASTLINDADQAQDVAQTAIMALLGSKQPVTHVKGWLRRTAYNLSMQSLRRDYARQSLADRLVEEPALTEPGLPYTEADSAVQILPGDIKRILSPEEYSEWSRMHSAPTLKAYAQDSGINYAQARKRKHVLSRKLKSTLLREQGWNNCPEILDYQSLLNIKRFMQTLVDHAAGKSSSEIKRYCPASLYGKLKEAMTGYTRVDDWGISMDSDRDYQVFIFDASDLQQPKMLAVSIRLNRSNHIRIKDCKLLQLMGEIPAEKLEPISLTRGSLSLTLEDLRLLMS